MTLSSTEDIENIINCEIAKLIALLTKRKNNLLKELEINKPKEDIIITELTAMKDVTDDTLQNNELFTVKTSIQLQQDNRIEQIKLDKLKKRMEFQYNSKKLEELICSWGTIICEELIYGYTDKMETFAVDEKKHKVTHPKLAGDISHNQMGVSNFEGSRLWHDNIESYIQYGIAIEEETNLIYVAEANCCDKGRMSIFTEAGDYLKSVKLDEMKCPYGIAIHRDNIYLTDYKEHCVTHFRKKDEKINFILKFGSRGKKNDQFIYPGQLAVSPEGELYIPDLTNKRIQILGESLNYLRTLKHEYITSPRDIKIKSVELYILNSTPNCILVISKEGNFLKRLLFQNFIGELSSPHFFCLDSEGNFLVSDDDTKLINVFLMDEKRVQILGNVQNECWKIENLGGLIYFNGKVLTIPSDQDFKPRVVTYERRILIKKELKEFNLQLNPESLNREGDYILNPDPQDMQRNLKCPHKHSQNIENLPQTVLNSPVKPQNLSQNTNRNPSKKAQKKK